MGGKREGEREKTEAYWKVRGSYRWRDVKGGRVKEKWDVAYWNGYKVQRRG